MGAVTHHQDQLMNPVNFKTINARASAPRNRCPRLVLVVRRRGDRQLLADRLDPKGFPVLVDESHHLAG